MLLRLPWWPRSSSNAVPGCRTSRMRIRLLSDAKVASMWESKGDAARRRRGCVGVMALDFEGDEPAGEAAALYCQLWYQFAWRE